MKTLTIGFVALIATLNLYAQEPGTVMEPQKQDAVVQKTEQQGLMLKDKKVWLVENGESKAITEKFLTGSGMKVTPTGTLIFENGEKAKLREGDFVSLNGAVARPIPIGNEMAGVNTPSEGIR